MRVNISEIVVGERQRRLVSDVDKLAISIQRYGLLHPIVVNRKDNSLVAGFRRLEAVRLLKWNEIDVTFKDELSEIEKKEIELEENIQRQDLSWQEQVGAKKELDEIKRRIYGSAVFNPEDGWGLEDTAQALGESEALTKRDILLARAIEVMPELGKCKNKSDALKMLKSERSKMVREELVRRAEEKFKTEPHEELVKIIHGDCLNVMKEMSGEIFHMALSDPPFGKQLDNMVAATGSMVSTYKDTKEDMFRLYQESIPQIYRLLKENSHFYQFFPIGEDYGWYLQELRKVFSIDPIPLVCIKSRGGFTVDARFRYQPRYQPIFFCWKGRRALKMGLENGNVLDVGSVSQKEHVAETPVELFKIFIDQSSLPGESMLDPFCGSGNSLVACKEMRRRGVGIEAKEDYVNLIKSRIYE